MIEYKFEVILRFEDPIKLPDLKKDMLDALKTTISCYVESGGKRPKIGFAMPSKVILKAKRRQNKTPAL